MNKLERIKALYGKKKPATKRIQHVPRDVFKPTGKLTIKNISATPYDFQLHGVEFINHHNGNCILGDDMGLGKTAQILMFLHHNPKIRPALIICKSTLKLKWARETFMFMERSKGNTAYVLNGRVKKDIQEISLTGEGKIQETIRKVLPDTGIFIINYDILDSWVKELVKLFPIHITLDEAHNIKSVKTNRYKALKTIRKKTRNTKIIPTTGTLLENRPMDLYNAISMVNPNIFKNKLYFGKRYCGGKKNGFGWDFSGKSNTDELHHILSSIMIRRKKEDVLKELPSKTRIVIPLKIDMKQYNKIECYESGPAKREKLLQEAARGKLDAAMDWIEEFLSSGEKLVVFAYHKEIVEKIYQEFKPWAIKVDGSTKARDKQNAEEEFQTNKKVCLLVGNIKSAGEGLTLTKAYATATIELLDHTPSLHLQAEDRVLRIGQDADAVFAYYFMAIGTIDEENIAELQKRSKIAAEVMDGKDVGDFTIKRGKTK